MKQELVYKLLSILSKFTGKFFLYIKLSKSNELGKTAVQDNLGVWYVGNVYDKDDITYGIAQNGFVEKEETELLKITLPLIKPASETLSFYDIGANIGYYGLLVATKYNSVVQSFEPLTEYSDCIKKSIQLNGVSAKITINTLALSDKEGQSQFTKAGSGSSLEEDFNETPNLEKVLVQTDTLDNLFSKNNLKEPDFIKIDVEGHELSVLRGGSETITKHLPVIMIELCSTLRDMGRSYINPYYKETLSFLDERNYATYCIRDGKTLEKWSDQKEMSRAGMFFCLHRTNHRHIIEEITKIYKVIE